MTVTADDIRSVRVPVEHRVFGLDRRTFKFAIPVIVLAAFWMLVIPGVNHILKYDDPIEAGDELLVAPGITFTPTPGWNLEEGLRTTEPTRSKAAGRPVILTDGAITMRVTAGPFRGEPSELVEQIDKESVSFAGKESFNVGGEQVSIPIPGAPVDAVIEGYTSPGSEGVVGAYVFAGTGVKVDAVGPTEQISEHTDEIGEMLGSFAFEPEAGAK